MSSLLPLQEIPIALAAKNLNPNLLNIDLLKYAGIVPDDWELSRPTVYANNLVQSWKTDVERFRQLLEEKF
jgi:hypothetical protein